MIIPTEKLLIDQRVRRLRYKPPTQSALVNNIGVSALSLNPLNPGNYCSLAPSYKNPNGVDVVNADNSLSFRVSSQRGITMSFELWQKLPEEFLRMKYPRFSKYGGDVKRLIVELAVKQNFKCALCGRDRNLVVDHDHYPEEGPGDRFTVYNIRGLVCQGCNWDLAFYETEEAGGCFGWENVSCKLSSQDYEDYISFYECRADARREALLEKRIPNYWHRRLILDRFDAWYYDGGEPPLWYWRYKEQESRKIETPEDAVRVLTAILQFASEQFKKDPNFEPPEQFWKLMDLVRPIIDEALKGRTPSASASALLAQQQG
jgi:hypothetical protein